VDGGRCSSSLPEEREECLWLGSRLEPLCSPPDSLVCVRALLAQLRWLAVLV